MHRGIHGVHYRGEISDTVNPREKAAGRWRHSPRPLTFRRFTGEGGEGEIHDVHADDSWLQQA